MPDTATCQQALRPSTGDTAFRPMDTIRKIFRLMAIARIMARHDALFPLKMLDAPPLALKLAGLLAPVKRKSDRRPGERLALALQELGPSFIKLGQALSVRPDLVGGEIAEDLGQLRDRLPPFPAEKARSLIAEELGQPVDELFCEFDDKPVAAASVAQVHFARVQDADGTVRDVAVKIARPGVAKAFARDMSLFMWLARQVEMRQPAMRRLKPVEVVRTLQDSIDLELDFRMEAAAADELAENFPDDPDFYVPAVDWARTGRQVMTLERLNGIRIDDTDALLSAGIDLAELSEKVIRIFLRQTLNDGFFHADMHHGNLFVLPDGRVGAVDFGIMGRLDRKTVFFMAEMLGSFIAGDYRRAAEVHFEAGYVPSHKSVEVFAQACRSIGAPIRGLSGDQISIGRLLAQLFAITETFDMQTRPELLLLQKTMVTVEGVASGLNPDLNFWEASEPVIRAWADENASAEAVIADHLSEGIELARKIPDLVRRADVVMTQAEGMTEPGSATGNGGNGDRTLPIVAILAAVLALLISLFH